jgi:isoquinoline 1-oxidoreductase alpha subunit
MSENLTYTLTVNGKAYQVTADSDLPLLWVLRDVVGLTGTKYGCGITACKACSVLVDGVLERSCDFDAKNAAGKKVQTVEGLAATALGKKLQRAWIDEQVPQCGYCQSGMLMAAMALLRKFPQPSDENIREYMENICVCGTYQRVRRGIRRAAGLV